MVEAVIDHGRPVAGVAAGFGVAWWTTQKTVNAAVVVLPDVDGLHVKHLGIDGTATAGSAGSATPTAAPGGGSSPG